MKKRVAVMWFHGGVPGLDVGDYLLPPSVTGKATLLAYNEQAAPGVQRADRVYLAREPRMAVLSAWSYPQGDVYEVVPEGAIEPDTDCLMPGQGIQCERARIVRVTRRGVTLAPDGRMTR